MIGVGCSVVLVNALISLLLPAIFLNSLPSIDLFFTVIFVSEKEEKSPENEVGEGSFRRLDGQ